MNESVKLRVARFSGKLNPKISFKEDWGFEQETHQAREVILAEAKGLEGQGVQEQHYTSKISMM